MTNAFVPVMRRKLMTKKQIIIDGVDVSECKHLYKEIDCLAHIDFSECCEGYNPSYGYCPNTDCYYKQLKRKEQECEEKQKTAQDAISKLCTEKSALYNELDKLKRDNDLFRTCHDNEQEKRRKYEQTLTEIKEIAETISLPMGTGKSCNRVILAKQILQKISECEVENDNA